MKKFLFLACFAMLTLASCNKDDDDNASSDLEDVEFAFSAENPPIEQEVVTNLSSSSDPNAVQIASYLNTANGMATWFSYFDAPEGAVSSGELIGSCAGNGVVYSYSSVVEGQQVTVAYQLCETDSKYIYQVFYSSGGDFERFVYAETSKGEFPSGYMEIYAIGDTENVIEGTIFTYTWDFTSDGAFVFELTSSIIDYEMNLIVNTDNSGELEYKLDGQLFYEATWDASGTSGTFTNYDTDGNVLTEGNWPG